MTHFECAIGSRKVFLAACAIISGALLAACAQATELDTELNDPRLINQREQFIKARAQLGADDKQGFERSLTSLEQYPLYNYLVFERLQKQWNERKPTRDDVSTLNEFERRSNHRSLTRRLTRTLQTRFAETEQWALFLGVSKSRLAADMPCNTLRAKYETGQLKGFDEAVLEFWVKPAEPDEVCAGVIDSIAAKHTPPVVSIWEKIYQAMEANQPDGAKTMLKYLASADRERVERWIAVQDEPQKLLLSGELKEDTVLNRRIIADLLVDWSRNDTKAAVEHWLAIRDNYTFFADRYYDTHRALVMRAAYRRLPEAQQWLTETKERDDDLELAEWRVRTALYVKDWTGVLNTLALLPVEEQEEDHWVYWSARAYEQLGSELEAQELYRELALLQSYHGFLAADRIGADYAIYNEPINPPASLLEKLRIEPALVRARELKQVGMNNESRSEWNNWISGREPEELATSAVLASEWELYDRAIYAAGRSGEEYRRAISIRFPLLYRSDVATASTEYAIEPAWIFGVMRRESAYIRDVRSSAGAIGLMQLMPGTAKYVAGLQGKKNWRGDLTDASTNISFGTNYLRYAMDKFDDNQVLAIAAYNAGPHRVDAWLREEPTEADIWIDTILFTETRRYVRAVLAYAAIYDYQLSGKPQRLSTKLTMVPASPSI